MSLDLLWLPKPPLSRAGDSVKVPIGFGADGLKPACHSDINLWKVAAQKRIGSALN